eukprot:5751224-Pyramimonas_sp.AAC.1
MQRECCPRNVMSAAVLVQLILNPWLDAWMCTTSAVRSTCAGSAVAWHAVSAVRSPTKDAQAC